MNELIVIGDRVLIRPDDGDRQTKAGLFLPATVAERERVATGHVARVGPGYVTPNPDYSEDEPWAAERKAVRYIPLQARVGDFAFFLRKDAIEITFQDVNYLIVPHHAILALVRDDGSDLLQNLGTSEDDLFG